MIRQPIITVLGHVDHGKCVSADTQIMLANGQKKEIGQLYQEFEHLSEQLLDIEGVGLQLRENLFVLAEDQQKIVPKLVTHIWKLKKDKLIEVKTRDGLSIKITPEHPFAVLDTQNFEIGYKKAEFAKKGDWIIAPKQVDVVPENVKYLKREIIKRLLEKDLFVVFVNPVFNQLLAGLVKNSNQSIQYYHAQRHSRYRLSEIVKLMQPQEMDWEKLYDNITIIKYSTKKQRAGHRGTKICLPKTEEQFSEFFYVLGLIWGDGSLQHTQLSNNDFELLERYTTFFEKTIQIKTKIEKKRTSYEASHYGWKTFKKFIEIAFDFPTQNKSHTLRFPQIMEPMPNSMIREFISGLFDTDGFVNRNAEAEITLASQTLIQDVQYILPRFGVTPKCYYGKKYHRLNIAGKTNMGNFIQNIGFQLKRKQEKLLTKTVHTSTSKTTEMTPISGMEIKNLRVELGLSATELGVPYQKKTEGYKRVSLPYLKNFAEAANQKINNTQHKLNWKERKYILEKLKPAKTLKQLFELPELKHSQVMNHLSSLKSDGLIEETQDGYGLTELGSHCLIEWNSDGAYQKLERLKNLTVSQIRFAEIKEWKEKNNPDGWVYDLTQPKTHNFMANGLLIHNTKLMDKIRGTTLVEREAGAITQHIGATEVPIQKIQDISGKLLVRFGFSVEIPGLLFIDTPGHEAFTNLRKRGGSIADLAILVIDITQGIQPQTVEAIEILKSYKTPFIVALNKIDKIPDWQSKTGSFLDNEQNQIDRAKQALDERVYELVGKLYSRGFECERFDRVSDFTKQIAIVPISAIVGEGVPEILMLLSGLSQKFLKGKLEIQPEEKGKGVILDVKEEKGLGVTVDVILYEGSLNVGDTLVMGSKQGVLETKIRALLKPKALSETKDEKTKFENVIQVAAACGVKISAPELENALPGAPLRVKTDTAVQEIQSEIASVKITADTAGLIVKADTLGSLEALIYLMKSQNVPVRLADVGQVTRHDVMDALGVKEKDKYLGCVLAFHVTVEESAESEARKREINVFKGNVIYNILDQYTVWVNQQKEVEKSQKQAVLVHPAKIELLKGFVFRRSDPAVIGVRVLEGKIKPKTTLTKNGVIVGHITSLQSEGKSVPEGKRGQELAVGIQNGIVGRNIHEGDILYSFIPENQVSDIQTYLSLTEGELSVLNEIQRIQSQGKKEE